MIMTARRMVAVWAAAALAALGLSFAPWFARTIQGTPHDIHVSVDAWSGSTQWQWAVGLTVIGAVTAAATALRIRASLKVFAGVAAAMISAGATCLWLAQWWAIAHPPQDPPGLRRVQVSVAPISPDEQLWAIGRDSLATLARPTPGSSAGQTWASYLGGGLIVVTCLLAVGLLSAVMSPAAPRPPE